MLRSLRPSHRGFTLVEMIGVMAVLAILASFLAPSLVRQIQTAKMAGEDQNLSTIAQGILDYVNATQTLPDTNASSMNWASNVSTYTGLSSDKVLYVFPGQSSSRRMLIYDPALVAWGNMATNVWSTNAKTNPARVMIVSSSSADPNLTVTGITSANFTNLFEWNKNYSNGVVNVPANLPAAWQKKGEFLHVKTINLSQNFCQVSFRDCYAPIANITGMSTNDTRYTNQSQFIFTNQGSVYQVNCDTNMGTVAYVSLISAAGFNDYTFQTTITIPGGTNTFTNQPPPRGMVGYNNINNVNNLSSQTLTNIILKGTKIYLQGTQTYEIQNDSEFEFFNQTWTRKN